MWYLNFVKLDILHNQQMYRQYGHKRKTSLGIDQRYTMRQLRQELK